MSNTNEWKNLYAVILIALITVFLFADQNLMAPNLTQIAHDFGFSDVERDVKLGGHIPLAFWVIGGLVTLFIGYLTDLVSRKKLFVAVIFIGEIPCFLTGFVETYTQLFWLRALTGVAIGGIIPLTYSLIGDYFPARSRAAAVAWLGLALGIGIGGGQMLAGFIGSEYGWRLPFIIVAVPNFVLGLLFLTTIEEPARGRTEESLKKLIEMGDVYTGRINWSEYWNIFKIKTNILVFLQSIPGCIPWGMLFVFLIDFYAQDKGYGVESATLLITIIGAFAILGSFIGALIGGYLYNKKSKYLPMLCGTATLLGVIPMALLINYPGVKGVENPSIIGPLIIGIIAGFIVAITSQNMKTILLNVNAPETRGSIFSLFNLTDALGTGLGPFIVSSLIRVFGRPVAFNIANLTWVICGIILLSIAITFPKDEMELSKLLSQRAEKMVSR
ncbi:MAG: MFS transporter [Deltaproteobacteria bacterium]|nr:MFS transporter [Deltaproteobacteria bacterium]